MLALLRFYTKEILAALNTYRLLEYSVVAKPQFLGLWKPPVRNWKPRLMTF